MNEPLTEGDLQELERILSESGVGSNDDIKRSRRPRVRAWFVFVRSLIGSTEVQRRQLLLTSRMERHERKPTGVCEPRDRPPNR